MTAPRDLWRAVQHLRAAQHLLRGVYALDVLVPLNKAIRLAERHLAADRPAQGTLALEAPALDDVVL